MKVVAVRKMLSLGVVLAGAGAAHADSAPAADPFGAYARPGAVVAAVQTAFKAEAGQAVRLAVYDSEDAFLERAAIKHQAMLDEAGLAVLALRGLAAGEYAFVAYLDEDGDGKLKRGSVLGRPKEPLAFSNGVAPKLRKPSFDETKVAVSPGSVVVITIKE